MHGRGLNIFMDVTLAQRDFSTVKKTSNILPNFKYGTIWEDSISGHKIGCLDASKKEDVDRLMNGEKATLAIQDPPYNVDINNEFGNLPLDQYIAWSERWIDNTINTFDSNASLYI